MGCSAASWLVPEEDREPLLDGAELVPEVATVAGRCVWSADVIAGHLILAHSRWPKNKMAGDCCVFLSDTQRPLGRRWPVVSQL